MGRKVLTMVRMLLACQFLPAAWRLPMFACYGIAAGLGLLLVRVAEMPSYLSDDSRTCINCHIMVPEYTTWARSSHARDTVCNDCHVPHQNLAAKYAFKARDGLRHATLFTLRAEPQVITASAGAQPVIQENCRHCHARQLQRADLLIQSERRCTNCHRDVPHGRVRGLASTPHIPYPHLPPVTATPLTRE